MKRLRIFEISFIPPTNHRGARLKIKDTYWNTSLVIPYDHQFNNLWEMAKNHLEGLELVVDSIGTTPKTDFVMVENFNIRIK